MTDPEFVGNRGLRHCRRRQFGIIGHTKSLSTPFDTARASIHRQAGNIALAPRVRLLQRLEADGRHPDLTRAASRLVEAVLAGEKSPPRRATMGG